MFRCHVVSFTAALLWLLTVSVTHAQLPPVDITFGNGGYVSNITIPNYSLSTPEVILPMTDGRFLVGLTLQGSGDQDVGVMRFLSNGAIDKTFGTNGYAIIDWNPGPSASYNDKITGGMDFDKLGRIIVAGQSANGSAPVWALAVLTPAGILDPSFDGDGKQIYGQTGNSVKATGVEIDSDNSIIVMGSYGDSGLTSFRLARISPTGVIDPEFNLGFPNQDHGYFAKDKLGRFIAAHDGQTTGRIHRRLPQTLAADNSFDGDGVLADAFLVGALEEILIQSTGKIILVGHSGHTVTRYNDSGLDTSFGVQGLGSITFQDVRETYSATLDHVDRIILAGNTQNAPDALMVVLRFTANGQPDSTFGENGVMFVTDQIASNDYPNAIAVLPDGDLLIGGFINSTGGLVRIDLSDPTAVISNGGFETADSAQASGASKWVGANLSNDKRNCIQVDAHSGKCSFVFRGSATEKAVITQTIKAPAAYKTAGTGLVLAAWVRGTPNVVIGKVVISYTDGSTDAFSAVFGPSATYEYFTSAPFFLAKNAKQFKVSFRHYGVGDKLYLDDVALLPNGARFVGDVLPLPPPPALEFRGG